MFFLCLKCLSGALNNRQRMTKLLSIGFQFFILSSRKTFRSMLFCTQFSFLFVYSFSSNKPFTTKDRNNTYNGEGKNCAIKHHGAWWYVWTRFSYCHLSNLNGGYGRKHSASGVTWRTFKGWLYSLKRSEMKLKPKTKL